MTIMCCGIDCVIDVLWTRLLGSRSQLDTSGHLVAV